MCMGRGVVAFLCAEVGCGDSLTVDTMGAKRLLLEESIERERGGKRPTMNLLVDGNEKAQYHRLLMLSTKE